MIKKDELRDAYYELLEKYFAEAQTYIYDYSSNSDEEKKRMAQLEEECNKLSLKYANRPFGE